MRRKFLASQSRPRKVTPPLTLIVRCRGCATPYNIATRDLASYTGWCPTCESQQVRLRKATRIEWRPRRIVA